MRALLRAVALLVAVAVIAAAMWFLQPNPTPPWPSLFGRSDRAGGAADGGLGTSFAPAPAQRTKLGAAPSAAPKIGELAPDFTLLELDGRPVRLSGLRGKTVLVNFWATWCIPCRQEFPELVALYEENVNRGLVVLAVDLQEDPGAVRRFAAEFHANFPIVIDAKGDVAQQYHLIGPPTTFFVDESGVLRATQIGALTEDALTRQLSQTGFTR